MMNGLMSLASEGGREPPRSPAPVSAGERFSSPSPEMVEDAPAPMAPGETQQASPEEQALYERFVARAMLAVYDEERLPQILQALEGGGDPVEGLAQTTALIVTRVRDAAEKAGQEVPGDVLYNAGTEVFEDLAELSRVAKIKDYSEDPDAMEAAYFRALDHYRLTSEQAGRVDREAAMRDVEIMRQMDEAGELEPMMMRLAEDDPRTARGEEDVVPVDNERRPRGMMTEMA